MSAPLARLGTAFTATLAWGAVITASAPVAGPASAQGVVQQTDRGVSGHGADRQPMFNVACTNTAADQAEAEAAVSAAQAAGGGTVQFGSGTCLLDGLVSTVGGHNRVPRVNFRGTGEYGATTIQATGRPNYVFTVRDYGTVSNLHILGAPGSLGGILLQYPFSNGSVSNVEVEGFTGPAWAIDVDGTKGNGVLRALLDYVYLYNNSHQLRLRGIVNALHVNNSTIAASTSTDKGSFIDAERGTSLDSYFTNVDFDSAAGANPILCSASGSMHFINAGFEAMAIGPGTVVDAKVIDAEAPCSVKLQNWTWTGFDTRSVSYAGSAAFLYAGANVQYVQMADGEMVQTDDPGSLDIALFHLQGGPSSYTSITNNYLACLHCATLAKAQAIFTNGIEAAVGTSHGDFRNNVIFSPGPAGGHSVWGFKQQLGSFTAPQTAKAAATLLDTLSLPARSFWPSRMLRWTGCGVATGSAGAKTIDLIFEAGSSNSYNVATSASGQSWCSTVDIFFQSFRNESVNVNGIAGKTPIVSVTASSLDTRANAPTFRIVGGAGGGDSITLTSSYWEMQ
jgi:hypothetical protein